MSSNRLTLHLDPPTKRDIRERAEETDESMSSIAREAIRQYLSEERAKELNTQTLVEERIEELVSIGIDELTETANQIAKMNAKMGVYSVANFEMIKQQHPDAMRRDALSTGSKRLKKDLNEGILSDLDIGTTDDTDENGNSKFPLNDRERVSRGESD